MSAGGLSEIRDVARRREPDRYLAALLSPAALRDDLVAVAAFSGELLRIVESASEPTIGQIRLQWWHDALASLARGGAGGHPVAEALGQAMRRHKLPLELCQGLVDARQRELEGEPLADEAAVDEYLAKSEGAAFELALRILGVAATPEARAAAEAAGSSYGLTRGLNGLPLALRRGVGIVSASRMKAAGPDASSPQLHASTPEFRAALATLRQRARDGLAVARQRAAVLGPGALPAFLPLVMVGPYLRAQERNGFDPLEDAVVVAPIGRAWRIWRAHRRGAL